MAACVPCSPCVCGREHQTVCPQMFSCEASVASPVPQLSCFHHRHYPQHSPRALPRAHQNQRQGLPACLKGPATVSSTAHARLPGRAREQGDALQQLSHLQSTSLAPHQRYIPSRAVGAEIKHINALSVACLANIQQHSIAPLSTRSAPSLGTALKWELEAGGGGLEGGRSHLAVCRRGCCGWEAAAQGREGSVLGGRAVGELVPCRCWAREQARNKPGCGSNVGRHGKCVSSHASA